MAKYTTEQEEAAKQWLEHPREHTIGMEHSNKVTPLLTSDDSKRLRENVRRNMGLQKKTVYRCYDKEGSPFKVGCNCKAEFSSFGALREHLRQGKKGVPPAMASRYFIKGLSVYEV